MTKGNILQKYVQQARCVFQQTEDIVIANMIGQHKIKKARDGTTPIRYKALCAALNKVGNYAAEGNCNH